ncbi:Integrase catalytic core protein [Phytophthora palmivora]|uniref:Integrase catalytic core protein n=1 Tax=Phytophthora palmivora TaxID=4796 RepID=A0A2P4Y5T8_9STRA|nr:Integrase catalytic core protein [Phytophthora palmivora]
MFWRASANAVEASGSAEPKTFQEVVNGPEQAHWRKAIRAELKSMRLRGVFRAAKLPNNQRAVGFVQKYGIDYTETFSPVGNEGRTGIYRYTAVGRGAFLTTAIAKYFGWPIDQLDVVTAFLYGLMKEKVFCSVPEGLKQALRVWNETFDEYVRSIGFRVLSYDPSLYIKIVDGECVLLLVYVDDVLVTGSSAELIAEVIDNVDGSVTLNQARYIKDILKLFGMQDCKPAASPVDISMKLVSSDATTKLDAPFREAVGVLMHSMTSTRPDIAFAVGYVSRFMENLQVEHWIAVKRIFRFLQGTKSHGIQILPGKDIDFQGFSDADWAGDVSDRNEAEYIALSHAIQEGKWMHKLLCEILVAPCEEAPALKIYEDNQSCIKMIKNPVNHGRAKHIDIKYHHIRDEVKRGEVIVENCETATMLADILTKGLAGPRHKDLTAALGVHACSH